MDQKDDVHSTSLPDIRDAKNSSSTQRGRGSMFKSRSSEILVDNVGNLLSEARVEEKVILYNLYYLRQPTPQTLPLRSGFIVLTRPILALCPSTVFVNLQQAIQAAIVEKEEEEKRRHEQNRQKKIKLRNTKKERAEKVKTLMSNGQAERKTKARRILDAKRKHGKSLGRMLMLGARLTMTVANLRCLC